MYVSPNTQKPVPPVMAMKLVFHLFLLIGMYPSNCRNPHSRPAHSSRLAPMAKYRRTHFHGSCTLRKIWETSVPR